MFTDSQFVGLYETLIVLNFFIVVSRPIVSYRIAVSIYKGPLQDPTIFNESRPSTAARVFIP